MSRSLTPKKEERSAATREMRSEGSSIARRTASVSWTSWRSKKDLPPSTVKRKAAASSASARGCIRVSRRASTSTSPARLRRVEEIVAARVRGGGEAEGDDRGLRGETRGRLDGPVGWLVGLVRGLDQLGEDAVDEAENRRARAGLLGQKGGGLSRP